MKFLFDTGHAERLFRRAPSPVLLRRLAGVAADDQARSSVTLGELFYGAHRLGDRPALTERIESVLTPYLFVLPFDAAAARKCAELRAALEWRGTPIANADMQIAAIQLANELVVVARNTRHFEHVGGLPVENWLHSGELSLAAASSAVVCGIRGERPSHRLVSLLRRRLVRMWTWSESNAE